MSELTNEQLDYLEKNFPENLEYSDVWDWFPALLAVARELASLEASHSATLELANNMVAERQAQLADARAALEFYADPNTYFAFIMIADHPCGEFDDDFEELTGDLGHPDGGSWYKPGKRARAALARLAKGDGK